MQRYTRQKGRIFLRGILSSRDGIFVGRLSVRYLVDIEATTESEVLVSHSIKIFEKQRNSQKDVLVNLHKILRVLAVVNVIVHECECLQWKVGVALLIVGDDEILEGVGLLTQQRHGVSISAPADHEDNFD